MTKPTKAVRKITGLEMTEAELREVVGGGLRKSGPDPNLPGRSHLYP
jgi:hypothetical protein